MSRILAIDDKQDNLIVISSLLKNRIPDCNVITAQSGAEGLEKAKAESPDTILLDISMPGMDGYEVCKILKEDESTRHIPVIMLTAIKIESQDRVNGLEAGADAYIAKPIDESVLIAQINTALRIKRAEDTLRKQKDLLEETVQERTRELRKSEEKYRTLFEDSRDAIIITNKRGLFLDVNQSALDLFDYSREEIMATTFRELYVDPVNGGKFVQEIEQKGSITDYPVRLRRKDGTELACLFTVTAKRAKDGSIIEYQGIIRDITKRRRLEAQLQQAQKMEAIGTLAGGIAHDFNNILAAIIGYMQLANLDIAEGDKAKENLEGALKTSRRAKDLVKQILAFSRQSEEERIPIQMRSIVEESIKLLRASLPATIEIRKNIKSDLGTIEADPTQMQQVIMNLGTNALHAMSEEGGVLEVNLQNVSIGDWGFRISEFEDKEKQSAIRIPQSEIDLGPGKYVRLIVSDTGHGMDKEVVDRIFDPYFTTKEKGRGTGLGLSVVHGIVKGHGGAITVYSEPGKGSTFHVYIPVIQMQGAEEEEEEDVEPLPTGTERILFIDDEPALVDIGRQMLERLGYDVDTRTSSLEALELFRKRPDQFDLVITDMTMPNMTGDRLAMELMQIRPDIPIILCTGYSERISEEKAKEMGIKAFAMKPVVMRDLANTVRKVLDRPSTFLEIEI